nr:hypothetical protein [Candidatus Sigynarchaeota archaeon]
DTYLLAYQRYDLYAIAWGIPYGVMYLAAFALIYAIGPIGPLIAWTIGTLVQFVWSLYYVKRVSDFPVRDLFSWRKEYNLFRKMFSFNFLYSLANLCFSLLTTTLLITMGNILGILTYQEVQSLGVISTFSNILINVFGIVAGIQPAVSQAFALKNKKLVNNYFLASVKFPVMMSVAVITFFIIYAQEMIGIFFSSRYITIGLVIMIFLMPSYAFGSFASRYDNILAGVGRPETAIVPWFVGMAVALLGFFMTWAFVPGGLYLQHHLVTISVNGVPTVVDYGITLSFIACLASMAVGLTIPGIWIVWISIKVLNVRVPRAFTVRPVVSALVTGVTFYIIKIVFPFKELLDSAFGDPAGGIVFTVIMVFSGVFIFLTLGTLIGAFTREDGRFWRSVIGTIHVARQLLSPVFKWGRFLLQRVPRRFKTDEYAWITSTRKEEMLKDVEFTLVDDFMKKYPNGEVKGTCIELTLQFSGIKAPFYGVTIIPKIDMRVLHDAIHEIETIDADAAIPLRFTIPDDVPAGHHEFYIDVEMYTEPTRTQCTRNSWFNFAFKWFDEKILFITLDRT